MRLRRGWRPKRTPAPMPAAQVRVRTIRGRALPVRYVRGDAGWTAMVRVPHSRLDHHGTTVHVDVLTPGTAVLLATERGWRP